MITLPQCAKHSRLFLREFALARAAVPRVRVIYKGKRGGRKRRLAVPPEPLMGTLKKLSRQLTTTLVVHDAAMGFRRGVSIAAAARVHEGCQMLLHFDLRDFFEQVRRGSIAQALGKVYAPDAVSVLCDLVTYRFRPDEPFMLPQGYPTSPAISNAVLYDADADIARMCERLGWRYCRYADDLFLSGLQGGDEAAAILTTTVEGALAHTLGEAALEGHTCTVTDLSAGDQRACKVLGYVVSPHFGMPHHKWQKLDWWRKLDERDKLPVDRSVAYGLACQLAEAEPERAAPYLARFKKEQEHK